MALVGASWQHVPFPGTCHKCAKRQKIGYQITLKMKFLVLYNKVVYEVLANFGVSSCKIWLILFKTFYLIDN